jgi:hypothetical protein
MKYIYLSALLVVPFHLEAKPCKKDVLLEQLSRYYSHQNEDVLKFRMNKVSGNDDKWMRSLPRLYTQLIADNKEQLRIMEKAGKHKAYAAGDAHMENFGFTIDNQGLGKLGLNDLDDPARSPVVMDVLKLSQSAYYNYKKFDQPEMIKSYLRGLEEAPHEFSSYIQKLSEKSVKGGEISKAKVKGEVLKFDTKPEFDFPTTAEENKDILKSLKKIYGGTAEVHDTYWTSKVTGGSAFGKRFHVLARIDGKIEFVELKQITDSAIAPELMVKEIPNSQRVKEARDILLGEGFDKRLSVVKIDGQDYQLRFKSKGNQSIVIDEIDKKELGDVIRDDFYILGKVHRQSLKAEGASPAKATALVDDYIKSIKSISDKDWSDDLNFMLNKVNESNTVPKKKKK